MKTPTSDKSAIVALQKEVMDLRVALIRVQKTVITMAEVMLAAESEKRHPLALASSTDKQLSFAGGKSPSSVKHKR